MKGKPKPSMVLSKYATFLYRCIPCEVTLTEEEVEPHRRKHYLRTATARVCDTCGEMFTNKRAWSRHLRKHETEKTGEWLMCKFCKRKFYDNTRLIIHMKRHRKERPYVCEVCGKGFKTKNVFNRHKYTHTAAKPFTCEHCGKGFLTSFNLNGHRRTHTGEKPYQCDICYAAFTHNVSLKTHKRSAHGVDMWKVQKTQNLKEYEEVNLKDPEIFKRQKVDKSLEESNDASTSQSELPASTSDHGGKSFPVRGSLRKELGAKGKKTERKTHASKGQIPTGPTVQPVITLPIVSNPNFHLPPQTLVAPTGSELAGRLISDALILASHFHNTTEQWPQESHGRSFTNL